MNCSSTKLSLALLKALLLKVTKLLFCLNIVCEVAWSSLTNSLWPLLNVIVPPVAEPVTKNPCPTGINLFGVLLLEPNPLIPAGATGAVPPVFVYVA